MKELYESYPDAGVIRLVQDNLNTHSVVSFYEHFDTETGHELKQKFEFHYTPKKVSWLNMVEIELSVLAKQCLDCRIGDMETFVRDVKAWEQKRNAQKSMVKWRFTTNEACRKLEWHYVNVRT